MSFNSKTETSGEANNICIMPNEKDTKKLHQKIIIKRRPATDKNWVYFLLVVFIIWYTSLGIVSIYHQDLEQRNTTVTQDIDQFTSNNESQYYAIAKNISEISHSIINKTNPGNVTATKFQRIGVSGFFSYIIDVYTFNLSHLSERVEKLDSASISPHLFISILFFTYSLVIMRRNEKFCKQSSVVAAVFIFVSLIEHLLAMLYAKTSIFTSLFPVHQKLAGWIVPDTLFLIICCSKIFSTTHIKKSVDNVPESIDNINDNQSKDDSEKNPDGLINKYSIRSSIVIHAIVRSIFMIISLNACWSSTMALMDLLGWRSIHTYTMSIGGLYIGVTMYYTTMMWVAAAIAISIKRRSSSGCDIFSRSTVLVLRCYLGTASYHATMIFPRLEATRVMNEDEFKTTLGTSVLDRFYITHFKIYNLSKTFTSVYGTSHRESIRILLRLYSRGIITKESLQNFRSMNLPLLMFLLSSNSILIILLWSYGIVDDTLALATWVLYLKIVFMFNMAMGFLVSMSDSILLSGMENFLEGLSDKNLIAGEDTRRFIEYLPSDEPESM